MSDAEKEKKYRLETQSIHAGRQKEALGSLVSPIYQSATFTFDNVEQGAERFEDHRKGYLYTRTENPTIRELERRMAVLEHTEDAAAFGSGMGAISSALLANLSILKHL